MAVSSLQSIVGLRGDFAIIGFELCGDSGEVDIGGVEGVAIGDDFGDVSVELSGSDVLVGPEVVLDGGEVHGFFDDLAVVGDAEGHGVHWLAEGPGGSRILEQVEDPYAGTQGLGN